MKKLTILLLTSFIIFGIVFQGMAQNKLPTLEVLKISEIDKVTHYYWSVNREIRLKLTNSTDSPILVYGRSIEGKFYLTGRFWTIDEQSREVKSSDPEKKAIIEIGSSKYTARKTLPPGESLVFSEFTFNTDDCRFTNRSQVLVNIGKSKKSQPIVTDWYPGCTSEAKVWSPRHPKSP